jgi:putative oxidoreductase
MRSLKATLSPAAPYGMVPIRLALFAILFHDGTHTVFGWSGGPGVGGTSDYYGQLGVPLPQVAAFVVGLVQTLGAVAFLVGAGVRFFGIAVGLVMLAAIGLAHASHGWNVEAGGIEYKLAIVAMCLALLLRGPGWASIEWADEEGAAPGTVS